MTDPLEAIRELWGTGDVSQPPQPREHGRWLVSDVVRWLVAEVDRLRDEVASDRVDQFVLRMRERGLLPASPADGAGSTFYTLDSDEITAAIRADQGWTTPPPDGAGFPLAGLDDDDEPDSDVTLDEIVAVIRADRDGGVPPPEEEGGP